MNDMLFCCRPIKVLDPLHLQLLRLQATQQTLSTAEDGGKWWNTADIFFPTSAPTEDVRGIVSDV